MKVTAIQLSDYDVQAIVNHLTSVFINEDGRQEKNILVQEVKGLETESDLFNMNATLEIETEMSEPDENNQSGVESKFVRFEIVFFYDGEEIEVNAGEIEDKVCSYFEN